MGLSHDLLSPPPIFIGGTGRSGTTILGNLIGTHPAYAVIPVEMRFHTEPHGLMDVLTGRLTCDEFEKEMLETFYPWVSPMGTSGLRNIIGMDAFASAVRAFVEQFRADRILAARNLFVALTRPTTISEGKQGWVEMSPRNIAVAAMLWEIFPEMKMIHSVRDGRDVAVSVARAPFGPRTPVDGLIWWNLWLRRAGQVTRLLPSDSIYLIEFERLVLIDRVGTLAGMCDYLDVGVEDLEEFFESQVTPARAHIGRWKVDLGPPEAEELNKEYLEMYDDLIYDGIPSRPITPYWRDLYT